MLGLIKALLFGRVQELDWLQVCLNCKAIPTPDITLV